MTTARLFALGFLSLLTGFGMITVCDPQDMPTRQHLLGPAVEVEPLTPPQSQAITS